MCIPPDCIAYQMGQAMQVHSGGLLQATPHCVRGPMSSAAAAGVSRNTFAVFMQPRECSMHLHKCMCRGEVGSFLCYWVRWGVFFEFFEFT